MPRSARLDQPGLLQHIMIRGINKQDIVSDDKDRNDFVKRLSTLLVETETACLAWVLLDNHSHLLLRPKRTKLARLMRRLLTGYAVRFNRRYQRSGHLFQNRYKSIVCEDDPYLLELVRYIHLNPIRAGVVKAMDGLDRFRWSGHAVLMGNREMSGQETEEVLSHFGQQRKAARRKYREFVMEGMTQGRREELTGGGLRRIREFMETVQPEAHDERILGSGAFVERVTREESSTDRSGRVSVSAVVGSVTREFGITEEHLKRRGRSRAVVHARNLICYFAVREMGRNGVEIGKLLNLSRSGVSIAADRGEAMIRNDPSFQHILDA